MGSNVLFSTGGGAMMLMHSGQSMLLLATSVLPSAVVVMIFMPPEAEQISCVACGLTMGDAMATPKDNTKPSNTQRASTVVRRKVWSRESFNIAKLSLMTSFQIVKASF